MFDYFGLELVHRDGSRERYPWRFATLADLRSAFYRAVVEDPSVDGYRVVEPDEERPVWSAS